MLSLLAAFLLASTPLLQCATALQGLPLPRYGGWRMLQQTIYAPRPHASAGYGQKDDGSNNPYADIIEANFTQPLDHLGNSNNITFPQRYYYTLRHYKKPSERKKGEPCPVYIFDNGELSAWQRLNILDHVIIDILAQQTGGIGIVLENRFFGTSHPPRSALGPGKTWTTDQFEFVRYQQSLADSVAFFEHLNITGVEEDLTAKTGSAAIILYGGSYAGARVAHLRKLFPQLVYGAISSSGVVASVRNNYGYYHQIARGNNATAIQGLQAAIRAMDKIVAPEPWRGSKQTNIDQKKFAKLLELFNLKGIKNPLSLGFLATSALGWHQGNSWYEPHAPQFEQYLLDLAVTNETRVAPLRKQREQLGLTPEEVPEELLRLAGICRARSIDSCVSRPNSSAVKCFEIDHKPVPPPEELDDGWVWFYMACMEFGQFQTASPTANGSLIPQGPKIVSALLDEAATSDYCKVNYAVGPSGKFPMAEKANNTWFNSHGNFSIDMPRLALVNGQFDPWREVSAHSELYANGGTRPNSLERPTILIPDGIHHDDEYGVVPGTNVTKPWRVQHVQDQLIAAVKSWLADWEKEKARERDADAEHQRREMRRHHNHERRGRQSLFAAPPH